ncbi:YceI family protein [Corynebacterium urealyticum]|uniref:Putative secreted protein n=1 Tax=Corynebacterium urealyticum (strain ATCC 43042 / DSM 7109) TaxID=504474 RepID=B1VDW6_CORU7|nr:YceI family protein [Corynebacterium urealyticum]QQC41549.1 YceI family protein [Corynebacterium urealyticum]CAQ05014.1 putative secreted protein [Corynebacterium urealyticum DSM 7109]SNV84592.1 putative secreted protein [Corynebacterium urealyticum]
MRKGIITLGVIGIIAAFLFGVGPIAYQLLTDRGLQTADLVEGGPEPTTSADGHWVIVPGAGANHTQAGYTFREILPGQEKTTSGRADNSTEENIKGDLQVTDGTLTEGLVEVRVAGISSDVEKRDINVRRSILHTEDYPKAKFSITEPVDLSKVPEDGSVGEVEVTGDLTLRGESNKVTAPLKVLRTGDKVVVQGKVPFKRSDFNIETREFVAAKIADEGTIDLLLVFEKP